MRAEWFCSLNLLFLTFSSSPPLWHLKLLNDVEDDGNYEDVNCDSEDDDDDDDDDDDGGGGDNDDDDDLGKKRRKPTSKSKSDNTPLKMSNAYC